MYAVVVLPLVPVMPRTRSVCDGDWKNAFARMDAAATGSLATICGNVAPGDLTATTAATAPRAWASCRYWMPSVFVPLRATNRSPGETCRESSRTPVTSTLGTEVREAWG